MSWQGLENASGSLGNYMETNLDLIITANHANLTADFRLLDSAGSQVAYRQTDFKSVPVSLRQALFDLRDYLELYVEPGRESESVALASPASGQSRRAAGRRGS